MTTTITAKNDQVQTGQGSLLSSLAATGRMPPITMVVKPLERAKKDVKAQIKVPSITLDRFLSYTFSSSILVPVDSFSFSFVAPDGPPLDDLIRGGDIVQISANGIPIATGLIDTTEVETESDYGEKGSVAGRDLMCQLEDQDAISISSLPIWANVISLADGIRRLLQDTRISANLNFKNINAGSIHGLLATEPGESKLAALQRFLEGLNLIAWMAPNGTMNVGKPTMIATNIEGNIFVLREKRDSNVLSIKVTRAEATIPNIIVPIWTGQETTQARIAIQPSMLNHSSGPSNLYKLGHLLPKAVIVSAPNGTDPASLSKVNEFNAGHQNLLQYYALRETARYNIKEIDVQVIVPGHFNEKGQPYVTDTCYHVQYDRGKVDEVMYLYHCEYSLTPEQGQRTTLYFCRLGCIVADVRSV